MEEELAKILKKKGPLTGQVLSNEIGGDALILWRTCRSSQNLAIRTVGTRYLRLDRRIEGYARISPSLLREFLTYTVVGLSQDPASLAKKSFEIESHIREVSRSKSELVYSVISALADRFENEMPIRDKVCFILAGDIVYNMAHDVPRPERSTGKLVRGSDMDLVVVTDDQFKKRSLERLDEAIYREKSEILIAPHLREEIDYVVKNLDRVRQQIHFDTFRHMVACKILHEGTLLYGSEQIFHKIKTMLAVSGVVEKLAFMEKGARIFRKNAVAILLKEDPHKIKQKHLSLFYPTEESEEFE